PSVVGFAASAAACPVTPPATAPTAPPTSTPAGPPTAPPIAAPAAAPPAEPMPVPIGCDPGASVSGSRLSTFDSDSSFSSAILASRTRLYSLPSTRLVGARLEKTLRQEDETDDLNPFGEDIADDLAPLGVWIHPEKQGEPAGSRDQQNQRQGMRPQEVLELSARPAGNRVALGDPRSERALVPGPTTATPDQSALAFPKNAPARVRGSEREYRT